MNAHQRRVARRAAAANLVAEKPVLVIRGPWRLGRKTGWRFAVIYKWRGLFRVVGR